MMLVHDAAVTFSISGSTIRTVWYGSSVGAAMATNRHCTLSVALGTALISMSEAIFVDIINVVALG